MADIFGLEAFEETINGGDGYDLAGWVAFADAGCTVDPDEASDEQLAGLGDEVLQCISVSNVNEWAAIGRAGAARSTIAARVYCKILSEAYGNNDGQYAPILLNSVIDGGTAASFRFFQAGASRYVDGLYYNDAAGYSITTTKQTLPSGPTGWWRYEIKWVSGTSVEFRVYNGHAPSTTLWSELISSGVGTKRVDRLFCGLTTVVGGTWSGNTELHMDMIRADDADWVGPESVGWTGKIIGVTNPAKINGVAATGIGEVIGVA